jgi:hypothetical protein
LVNGSFWWYKGDVLLKKLYKNINLDSIQQFKEMLDEKIMIIQDKLNLRTFRKSTMFNLDDYKSFISTLDENIYEMKVYECFN